MTMDYRKIMLLSIAIILLANVVVSRPDPSNFNPTVDDWYAVDPWEIDFCRKYGGDTGESQGSSGSPPVPVALSQMTVTIQGEVQITEVKDIITNRLYKVSWYIEPPTDDVEYTVVLVGDGEEELELGVGLPFEPGSGYFAEYRDDKKFTHVQIRFRGTFLEVPIIPSGDAIREDFIPTDVLS